MFCLLTLVLLSLSAASSPHSYSGSDTPMSIEDPPSPFVDRVEANDVTIVNPINQKVPDSEKSRHFQYLQSLTPTFGALLNTNNSSELDTYFGILYMAPSYNNPQLEIGISVTTSSLGILHINKKYIANPRQFFRPFGKWGVSHIMDSDKKLASFVNIENYFIQGTLGFEDMLSRPFSFRASIDAYLGLNVSYFGAGIGISYAF